MTRDNTASLLVQQAQDLLSSHAKPKLLIVADENSLDELDTYLSLSQTVDTHLLSNRFDIVEKSQKKGINANFNDFDFSQLLSQFTCIIYRISKEKLSTHHIFNQILKIASPNTTILIAGKKNEGMKSYSEKLKQLSVLEGGLKKQGNDYIASFTVKPTASKEQLTALTFDDGEYTELKNIDQRSINNFKVNITSKPGIFGWNKIDEGSRFLTEVLSQNKEISARKYTNALDLGCGYGYLTLFAASLAIDNITATDNNAAAIQATKNNANINAISASVIAADCANSITETFSLILCNPPFHQGFSVDSSLTKRFIQSTKEHLAPDGRAYFVTNAFIGIEKLAVNHFKHCKQLANNKKFKILEFYN